ncbi:TIGR02466 family protein [Aurantiacibacter poecillastricola]|uniref:TIGR02466 family protein n=1 Tax=Aurantiacibacter poecillastricola TaxID=3064385 RepID=UPI00273E07BD|nr:TIGR02466 family protein [Aurantiacibacter sp. 219JJ12-13]MDP5261665.1 TIGR02466 family protein [Aurantiacibacter sp. 219JJ12-13]
MATKASAGARDYTVKPLFAEPYFVTSIAGAITAEQVAFIQSLKMNRNQVNHISDDLYIFRHPELASIAKAVDGALQTFATEVMGIAQRLEVTQSWALMNPPGVGMHGHTHSNSLVSGSLYYAPLPDPPGNMIFERHNTYRQLELAVDNERTNIYNAPRNAIVPKEGDLVLFSSSLQHYVEPNQTKQDRHSIAFNSFVRGKIGSFRDVSELEV